MPERINIEEFESYSKITFYTVRYDEEENSETDKFFLKYRANEYREYAEDMLLIIEELGEAGNIQKGSILRFEDHAWAFPPKKRGLYPVPPLRLYCYCVSNEVVILFGGGVKSSASAENSKELSMAFRQAQVFGKAIAKAIADKTLEARGKILYAPHKELFLFL